MRSTTVLRWRSNMPRSMLRIPRPSSKRVCGDVGAIGGKSGSLIGGEGRGHASVPRSSASTNPVATRSKAVSDILVRLLLTLFTVPADACNRNVFSNVQLDVEVLNQFLVSVTNGHFSHACDFCDFTLRTALATQN